MVNGGASACNLSIERWQACGRLRLGLPSSRGSCSCSSPLAESNFHNVGEEMWAIATTDFRPIARVRRMCKVFVRMILGRRTSSGEDVGSKPSC